MQSLIESELDFSSNVIRSGHEVTPRFLIHTPEADYTIIVPMPDALPARLDRLNLVSSFMAYKLATGFIFSSELEEPDAVSAIGVVRSGTIAGIRLINRHPLKISSTHWYDGDQVGGEIPSLLPSRFEALSAAQIAEIEAEIKAFSPSGIETR